MSSLSILFLVFVSSASWAALPSGWKACKLGQNDCFISAVNDAVQTLKNGNKQLGVQPLEPLRITSMIVDQGSGPVAIKMEFNDMDIVGLSNCRLNSVKNSDWRNLEGNAFCKAMEIEGNYKVNGKVLTLPISGEGKNHLKFEDVNADIHIKLKEVERQGKKYFDVESLRLNINPKKSNFNFENLFDGNKALSDNMNVFLNENSEAIVKELQPAFSKGLSQAFTQVAKQIFSHIPTEEINIK